MEISFLILILKINNFLLLVNSDAPHDATKIKTIQLNSVTQSKYVVFALFFV